MKKLFYIFILSGILALPLLLAGSSLAVELEPPIKAKTFEDLIDAIINFVFWIGIALAPLLVLIGGFMYMTAAGDAAKITKARTLLIYTAVGFAIILFAKGLIAILESVMRVAD